MGTVLSSTKYTPDGVPYHTLNDFQELKRLDSGGHSTVFKGYDVTRLTRRRRMVAVKVFNHVDVYAERGIEILKKVSHPNIVELFGVIWDEKDKDDPIKKPIYTGYVMEYMELGNLHKEIHDVSKQYDLKLIALWINQIGSGLQYLHENGILHRDVNPYNILLATRTHLKLAGFGLACNISHKDTDASGPIGTIPYMAPEVRTSNDYGVPADVYSFGVTIWEIIHRKRPDLNMGADSSGNVYVDLSMDSALLDKYKPKLRKRSPQERSKSSKSGLEQVTSTSCNIDKALATFLQRMLSPTPSERPSIKEIIEFFSETVLPNYLNTILVVGRPLKTAVLNQDEWLRLQIEVPQDIHLEGGAVCLNNEMYLVGEYFHHRGLYKLDKNNYNWIRLADMQVGRQWITNSCLEWNGSIWVFGGENEETGEYLNSVERYDPSGNEWITMPDMTYPRRAAAATVCNGKIYVCGGRTGQADRPNSVECFDLESGVWNELVALPIPLYGHSLVSYGHKLIVMGGYDGRAYSSTVLELDPLEKNGQWRELAPMSHGCAYFAGLVLDEDIYVIGGRDEAGYTSRVQIFNSNEWRDGPTLPSECSRPSAVVIPRRLFI